MYHVLFAMLVMIISSVVKSFWFHVVGALVCICWGFVIYLVWLIRLPIGVVDVLKNTVACCVIYLFFLLSSPTIYWYVSGSENQWFCKILS